MPDSTENHRTLSSQARDRPSSSQLRQVLERILREGNMVAELDGTSHKVFPVGIDQAEGEALRNWVIREKATNTIEIGLAYGISALFICDGLLANGSTNARHVALDPFQQGFANCGLQLLKEAGVASLVEHQPTESHFALPKMLAEGRQFDFAFIDGNHKFDGVFVDLTYIGQLVRKGGVIFLDDYQLQSVTKALSFCVNNLGWTIEEEGPENNLHRWVVVRTSPNPPQRKYDHFVDF